MCAVLAGDDSDIDFAVRQGPAHPAPWQAELLVRLAYTMPTATLPDVAAGAASCAARRPTPAVAAGQAAAGRAATAAGGGWPDAVLLEVLQEDAGAAAAALLRLGSDPAVLATALHVTHILKVAGFFDVEDFGNGGGNGGGGGFGSSGGIERIVFDSLITELAGSLAAVPGAYDLAFGYVIKRRTGTVQATAAALSVAAAAAAADFTEAACRAFVQWC
ncbi:unnamed protein product, partial [Phaeothamnion confervicola]